jgi:hypothetical protein
MFQTNLLAATGEHAMDFKDLLTKQGFNLDKVMVLRHRPKELALRKVLPWLAAERPHVFNAYQREQNPDAEKALMKAEIAASFIAQEDEKALFVVSTAARGRIALQTSSTGRSRRT